MSRQREMIDKAARECGIKIEEIEWSPIGKALEMQGPSGGWVVYTNNSDIFVAYNAGTICNQMREWKARLCPTCNGERVIERTPAGAGHSDDLAEYDPCPDCDMGREAMGGRG